jgi:predicted CopG family antitoxin
MREKLKRMKLHPRESYEEVIRRLLEKGVKEVD